MKCRYEFVALAVVLLVGGCTSPSLYHWGHYENKIYQMYAEPDKATAEQQVHVFEADMEKARSKNKPMPPGFHAHLGYLYFQLGNAPAARSQFELEKKLFPESAVLMDRFIKKLEG